MLEPALMISVFALLFTVFSFWWMYWRPGSIEIAEPRSYAAIGSESGRVLVELPFIFFNHGATPVVVHNLRLKVEGCRGPLFFNATVDKLGSDEGRRFAVQFAVRPQEALFLVCEFQKITGGFLFGPGSYSTVLEGIRGKAKKWQFLARFELNVTNRDSETINKQFIVHDNWVGEGA
jgi:hypothetical protein